LVGETHQEIRVDLGSQVRRVDDVLNDFFLVSFLIFTLGNSAVTGTEANLAFAENVLQERLKWVESLTPCFSDFLALNYLLFK
jgi:hypothetical protein